MKRFKLFFPIMLFLVDFGLLVLLVGCKKVEDKLKIEYGTVTDIEGNSYKTVKIGTQEWMAENLRTKKYRNGETITNLSGDTTWMKITTGAYCNYDYNNDNPSIYGRYYNWYAVNDGRNIAPTGWHVPTDIEWTILTTYLGGDNVAGLKLQESGRSTHWWFNTNATNESGFTAIGAGFVGDPNEAVLDGTILGIWVYAYWWTSTENNSTEAKCRCISMNSNNIVSKYSKLKGYGYSMRCIKDN